MSTAVTTAPAPEGQPSYLAKLLNGDLSGLTPEEQTAYYLERCRSIGVDPASQPFLFMQTKPGRDGEQAKTILYVTRSATDQIGKREGLTETIVSKELLGGIAIVVVRVTDGTRIVENIGAASFRFDYQAGDAIKRATTQGYRRAIIQFAGVGAVSEEDIDDIAGAQKLGMAGVTGTRTNPTTGEITASPAPKQLTGRAAEMPDTSRVRYPQQEAAKAEADGAKPATDKMYAVLIDLISQARSLGEPLNDPEAGMTIAQARTLKVFLQEVIATARAQAPEAVEVG